MKDFEVEEFKAHEIITGHVDNSKEIAEQEKERKKKI